MKRTTLATGITLWTVTAFTAGWFATRLTDRPASKAHSPAIHAGQGVNVSHPSGLPESALEASVTKGGLCAAPILTAAGLDSLAAMAAGSDAGAFALTAAVGSLSAEDAERMLAGINESGLSEDVQRHVSLLLRQQLARLDPVAALHAWCAKPLEQRDGTLTDIFFHLGLRDKNAAQQALADIEPDFRDQAITSLIQGAAASDQSAGLKLAVALGMQPESPVVHGLAEAWARREPESAATAAAALPHSWTGALLSTIMQNWAENDLAAAAAWAERQPIKTQAEAWPAMVENLCFTKGPGAAVRWAESLPQGSCREAALAATASRWAAVEPEAASAWATSLPGGAVRDATAAALAAGVQQDDPSGAAAWVAAISDPVKRREASRDFLTSWAAQQPEDTLLLFQAGEVGR